MFSTASAVIFKSAIGLLVNKDAYAEQANLQENDVPDHEFRNLVERKLSQAESEMSEREDLRKCIGHFSKGVLLFFTLFDKKRYVVESDEDSSPPISEKPVEMPCGEGKALLSSPSPTERLKNLKLVESEECKLAFLDAKAELKKAYLTATEAFNNEDLRLSDRIQAMAIRVAATTLEKIEYPEDALAPCMLYLEELHSMPGVQNSFARGLVLHKIAAKLRGKNLMDSSSRWRAAQRMTTKDLPSGKDPLSLLDPSKKVEYLVAFSRVCHVNRVLYDVVQTLGRANLLMTWPYVNTKRNRALRVEERVDPLRDSRVANVLRDLRMEHCCVRPWSFGQEGGEYNKLKDPRGIVASTDGKFIIADRGDHNVKVFDRCGKFEYSFTPLPVDKHTNIEVRDLAIDRNDCLYVLVRVGDSAEAEENRVCLFERSGRKYHFLLRKGFYGCNLTVNANKNVLVTDSKQTIEVYKPDGQLIRSIGAGTLKPKVLVIAAANDGRVMVLNKHDSDIQVFGEQGDLINNFSVEGSYHTHDHYPRISFHPASGHLIVAGFEKKKFRLDMLIYTKNGEFVRRIQYGEEKIGSIQGITVTPEGRFAAIVLQLDSSVVSNPKYLLFENMRKMIVFPSIEMTLYFVREFVFGKSVLALCKW